MFSSCVGEREGQTDRHRKTILTSVPPRDAFMHDIFPEQSFSLCGGFFCPMCTCSGLLEKRREWVEPAVLLIPA